MSPGPQGDERRREEPRAASVRVGDLVSGLLHRHKDALQGALAGGSVPEVFRDELRDLAVAPVHVLQMLKDPSSRRTLSVVLQLPRLVNADLSLEELRRAFIDPYKPEAGRFVQSCKFFLSTPETSFLGAVLLSSTLYPSFSGGDELERLKGVTGLMSRQLAAPLPGGNNYLHPGFENWRQVASKLLLWTYGTFPSSVSLDAYMQAAQLGEKCFGSLEDPADFRQAVRVFREYIPERADAADALYSHPVPVRLREGFGYEVLGRLLQEFPIQEQLVPWMKEMLAEVTRGFQACARGCAEHREEQRDKPWLSEEPFGGTVERVREHFNYTANTFADVCEFFAVAADHADSWIVRESQGPGSSKLQNKAAEDPQDVLRTELQDELGQNIAGVIRAFCKIVGDPSANLPCTARLAGALDELLNESLKLPLDIEAEESDAPAKASVYQGCMLRAFRNKVWVGDLDSAVNMRRLFPVAGYTGTARDTIDPFIDTHQDMMAAGVAVACRGLSRTSHLSPDSAQAVGHLEVGLRYLIRPELLESTNMKTVAEALSRVVRVLVASTAKEEAGGMTTYWGCQQAGIVLHRVRRNPELCKQVVSEALAAKNKILVQTIARFIERFNRDEQYGRDAGPVEALYDACGDFHECLPIPRTRHLSTAEGMKENIITALRKWQGGSGGKISADRLDLTRMEPFIATLETTKTYEDGPTVGGRYNEKSMERDAHAAMLLATWEHHVEETDSGIHAHEYHAHVSYLRHEARRMLKILDSSDFTPESFRATFSGLFVALIRGAEALPDSDVTAVAEYASRILDCKKNALICTVPGVCDGAAKLFDQIAHSPTPKALLGKGGLLTLPPIRELLNYWGLVADVPTEAAGEGGQSGY